MNTERNKDGEWIGDELYAAPSPVAQPQRKKFELTPEMKAALEEANKTGALHALLPNGDVMFINRGEQPEDTADLDCPHCGGSGHKGDIQPVAQDERTYNSLIERLRRFADLVKSNDDAGVMARRVEMLTSAADAIEKLQARAATPARDKQASPEELLAIARKTGLRTHMHGVDATNAKQLLADFVAALPAGSQDKQDAVDAAIGRFFMSLATQNATTSWPRLWKIQWSGYAQTREMDNKLHDWTLRDAIIAAMQAQGANNG